MFSSTTSFFVSLSLSLMLSLSYSLWLSLSASMLSFCVFVFAESAVFVSFIPTCTASAATFHRRATFKRFLQTTSRSAVRSYDRNRPYNFFLSLPLSLPLPIFGGFYFSLHGVSNAGTSNDCDDEDFFVARGLECEWGKSKEKRRRRSGHKQTLIWNAWNEGRKRKRLRQKARCRQRVKEEGLRGWIWRPWILGHQRSPSQDVFE